MKITLIAGARPNFMKVAPIIHAIKEAKSSGADISYRLVHTGQHYDKNMSDSFFEELNIPLPDTNLKCGGGTQAEQAAAIMIEFEKELEIYSTDLVIVVGDVTSTMACSIVAKKMNTKVAHVEAGIRSWDLTMPEEINRMVTDSITDLFFTTSEIANQNLLKLGVPRNKIHFVGNVMIDTLLANMPRFKRPLIAEKLDLQKDKYFIVTLHRPANVDAERKLKIIMAEIINNVRGMPVIFPMHPRTAKTFEELGIEAKNLHIIEPMGYLEFNYLVQNSKGVLTDSGGITEETTIMNVPCITLRDNTERPETITVGTNELIGTDPITIKPALDKLFSGYWKKGTAPELWDGSAAKRITQVLLTIK